MPANMLVSGVRLGFVLVVTVKDVERILFWSNTSVRYRSSVSTFTTFKQMSLYAKYWYINPNMQEAKVLVLCLGYGCFPCQYHSL